ncbi:MAG: hypothetical protein EA369_01755 [Bradymonadales bacterium]|nr:MAG: hypothetical protein EA369_01755 [Bradymonadales bacterium]
MAGDSKSGNGGDDDLLSELLGLKNSSESDSEEEPKKEEAGKSSEEVVDGGTELIARPDAFESGTELISDQASEEKANDSFSSVSDSTSLDAFLGADTFGGEKASKEAGESGEARAPSESAKPAGLSSPTSQDDPPILGSVSDETSVDNINRSIDELAAELFGDKAEGASQAETEKGPDKTLVLDSELETDSPVEPAMSFVASQSESSEDSQAGSSGVENQGGSSDATALEAQPEFLDQQDSKSEDLPEGLDEESDPIDRALREAEAHKSKSAGGSVDKPEVEGANSDSLKVTDLFGVDASKSSQKSSASLVSEKDFADVFQTGPIQVPGAKFDRKKKNQALQKVIAAAVAGFCFLGAGAWGFVQLRTDEGLFGYQLDGFRFQLAYQAPTLEKMEEYRMLFDRAKEAFEADDPTELEKSFPELAGILQEDVRNVQALVLLIEGHARLMAWRGAQPELAKAYDQWTKKWSELSNLLRIPSDHEAVVRAGAWRSLAVSDYSTGLRAIESLAQSGSASRETIELYAELLGKTNQDEKAKEWMAKAGGPHSQRATYLLAEWEKDARALERLAGQSYLPARLSLKLQALRSTSSLNERNLEALKSMRLELQDFPWLVIQADEAHGDLLARLGKSEEAREKWREITKNFSKQSAVWLKLARSHRQDRQWEEALEAYREGVRAGGIQRSWVGEFVELLSLRGRANEAFEVLDQAQERFPQAVELRYLRGSVHLSLFQEDRARRSFEEALEINSEHEPSILSLAQIAMNQELFEEAGELYARIPDSSRNQSKALLGRGRLSLNQRDFSAARQLFSKAIETDANNEEAYIDLLRILIRSERDQEAASLISRAESNFADSPWVPYMRSSLLRFRGRRAEALAELESSLELYSHLSPLHILEAHIRIDREEFDEAEKTLSKLEETQFDNPDFIFAKARHAFRDVRAERASSQLDLAWRLSSPLVQRYPDHEDYLLLRAEIGKSRGEIESAQELIARLKRLYPDQYRVYLLHGDLMSELGQFEKALAAYEEAKKRTRFRGEIHRSLGRLYQAQGNIARAVQNFERVVSWFPQDFSAHLELGRLYNDQAQYQRAIALLRRAAELRSSSPEPHFYLGFIFKERGQLRTAMNHFQKFLELSPTGLEAATIRDEIFFLRQSGVSN